MREVLSPRGLEALAAEITAEHRAFVGSVRTTLEHGIRCGELLTQAKGEVEHGGWLRWLKRSFGGSLSARTAQEYMQTYTHREELRAKCAPGAYLGMRAALNEVRKENARMRREAQPVLTYTEASLDERIEIIHGDFREVLQDADRQSVDLVFTDPPYAKKHLGLWSDLARVAEKLLKPGHYLVAYSGQAFLDEVMQRVREGSKGELEYYWQLAALNTHTLDYRDRLMKNSWKPILIWRKRRRSEATASEATASGAYRDSWEPWQHYLRDRLAPGEGRDETKHYHEWAQPLEQATTIVEALCPPGGVVLDPMCGSATIPLAALKTGRRGVGIEIDEGHYQKARTRLGEGL
jgi:DNA methylase/Protein of unknown function (DUF3102)